VKGEMVNWVLICVTSEVMKILINKTDQRV